ncbi:MAG: YaeQ family protein [Burkholderiaceae bacterium]
MALRSTIHKVELEVSDLDRHYYATHSLTLARHPSETEERMMMRLLAFCLHASPDLDFGRGLSTDDEPALWERDPTGSIERWVEVGLPDEKLVRRALGRARRVLVLAYGERKLGPWWQQNSVAMSGVERLDVITVSDAEAAAMTALVERSMKLGVTLQEGHVWLASAARTVEIAPRCLSR